MVNCYQGGCQVKETNNEQTGTGEQVEEALAEVAPAEDEGTERGRELRGGSTRSGEDGAEGKGGPDQAGLPGLRGGRSDSEAVHPDRAGAGRKRVKITVNKRLLHELNAKFENGDIDWNEYQKNIETLLIEKDSAKKMHKGKYPIKKETTVASKDKKSGGAIYTTAYGPDFENFTKEDWSAYHAEIRATAKKRTELFYLIISFVFGWIACLVYQGY